MADQEDIMEFGYSSELSLFKSSLIDTGVQKIRWIPYKPVSQMERGLEFVVNNNSSAYLDLSRTTLSLQVQVLKEDGTVLPKIGTGLDVSSDGSKFVYLYMKLNLTINSKKCLMNFTFQVHSFYIICVHYLFTDIGPVNLFHSSLFQQVRYTLVYS